MNLSPEPLRARHGKPPPLEARTNWDPWLPATEASAKVGGALHLLALIVLAIIALLLIASAAATVISL